MYAIVTTIIILFTKCTTFPVIQNATFSDMIFSFTNSLEFQRKEDEVDAVESKSQAMKEENSNEWYSELKWIVMQKYIHYLQTLGFCVVQIQPNAKGYCSFMFLTKISSF